MNDQLYKIKMGGREITEDYLSMSGQGDIQIIPIAVGSGPIIPILVGVGGIGAGTAIANWWCKYFGYNYRCASRYIINNYRNYNAD